MTDIKLIEGQRLFHHLGAPLQVVFEGAGQGLVQGKCAADGLHVFSHGGQVGLVGRQQGLAGQRHWGDDAASR